MEIMGTEPHLTWNLVQDLSEVLEYHFMVNALIAGSVVAVMAGLLGWLMVLRKETFAGHTLSMMAFPGAAGAALIGVPAMWGYFVFCVAGGLAIGTTSTATSTSWWGPPPRIMPLSGLTSPKSRPTATLMWRSPVRQSLVGSRSTHDSRPWSGSGQ